MPTKHDYFAICLFSGVGCWRRGNDRHRVVEDLLKQCVREYKGVFQLAGEAATVNLYEVTGHDNVAWSDFDPVHDADTGVEIPRLDVIETTFPGRKAKARAAL